MGRFRSLTKEKSAFRYFIARGCGEVFVPRSQEFLYELLPICARIFVLLATMRVHERPDVYDEPLAFKPELEDHPAFAAAAVGSFVATTVGFVGMALAGRRERARTRS